jgi:pyrimidine deaminase RibD-like protein
LSYTLFLLWWNIHVFERVWYKLSFILSFLFPKRLFSSAATYIFTAPNCTTTIASLEPCALNARTEIYSNVSAATYIFTAPICTTTIVSLEPCALNARTEIYSNVSAATYIFTAPSCTTTIVSLEPCALNARTEIYSNVVTLLIPLKEGIEAERGDRGWKEAKTQGSDFRQN